MLQVNWLLAGPSDPPVSVIQVWGLQMFAITSGFFYVVSEDPNSDPHV